MAGWTLQTLKLISQTPVFLKQNIESGSLVLSLAKSITIPRGVIQATKIIQSLRMVRLADWVIYSQEIEECVASLLVELDLQVERTINLGSSVRNLGLMMPTPQGSKERKEVVDGLCFEGDVGGICGI
ncbi:hypothetical protein BU17DRAFT_65824 [Hysterangium stoloniferum]|nr:hypothetical protein BU17DRAFT_65824 [Hysterangium stoloniferum]